MKKLFSILLSLQIITLLFFFFQSPVYAQWTDGDMHNTMYRQNMLYHHPFSIDKGFLNSLSFYKVAVDIALSILFITFFSKFIIRSFGHMTKYPFKNGYLGFTFLIIFPLISFILLGLLWLGVASFLFYGLTFLVAIFLTKVFIGWGILQKVEKNYVLDWKAGVVGPLAVFILLFIPILGWITIALILSMATGALLEEILPLFKKQHIEQKTEKHTS